MRYVLLSKNIGEIKNFQIFSNYLKNKTHYLNKQYIIQNKM